MAEPNFHQTQRAFAAYIRDPEHNPMPPGVKPERMAMYRELFFNNIKHFIGSSFPVLKSLLDETRWLELVHDFFARHRSTTPFFADLSEEFIAYLRNERTGHPEDPPFLLELAHYEWVELALSLADGEAPTANPDLEQEPLGCVISLSDVAWPLAYRFPVHCIDENHQPTEAPTDPTYLAVYRNREDDVKFLEINPVTYRLLQILEETGLQPAESCLRQIAQELGLSDPTNVLAFGAETLRELAERGVIGLAVAD